MDKTIGQKTVTYGIDLTGRDIHSINALRVPAADVQHPVGPEAHGLGAVQRPAADQGFDAVRRTGGHRPGYLADPAVRAGDARRDDGAGQGQAERR
jgi:hypothetical protein